MLSEPEIAGETRNTKGIIIYIEDPASTYLLNLEGRHHMSFPEG